MAKLSLSQSPKFKVLVRSLGIPAPYVRGHLEMLWESAHFRDDPFYSTFDEVEASAEWCGDVGKFGKVLLERNWLEEKDNGYVLHDYEDHIPSYVKERRRKSDYRKTVRGQSQDYQKTNDGLSPDCTGTVTGQSQDSICTVLGQSDQEKRREEKGKERNESEVVQAQPDIYIDNFEDITLGGCRGNEEADQIPCNEDDDDIFGFGNVPAKYCMSKEELELLRHPAQPEKEEVIPESFILEPLIPVPPAKKAVKKRRRKTVDDNTPDERFDYSDKFQQFWEAYPKSHTIKKPRTYALWVKYHLEDMFDKVMKSLVAWKECKRWKEDNGFFIKNSDNWIIDGYWEAMPQKDVPHIFSPDDKRGIVSGIDTEHPLVFRNLNKEKAERERLEREQAEREDRDV